MKSLVVCLVGLLVSVHASPVSPPVVSGQVRLADGSPVAGAQAVLFDVADLGRGPMGQATTDEAGQFALPLAASRAFGLPQGFALGPNYPNPFNPSTIIPYRLSASSPVRLEVFNILGQHMATLVDEEQAAGAYRARWDGTDTSGRAAASGVYFYRLTVAGVHQTGRMVLVDGQVGVPAGGPRIAAVPLAAGSTGSYGLVVSGEGLVAYVDAAFGVAVGQGPVDLVVEMQPKAGGKVGSVEPAVEAQPKVWRTEVPMLDGLLGDVDNNGRVDIDDGLLVAMHRVDPAVSLPNHGQIGLGDVDCNGRVERADAELLASYVANPSAAAVSSLRIGQRGGYSLDPVTERVWGSILGTEQQDVTVARLIDEVPVLISGVFEIDGRDYLYLGIDRDYYNRHGGEHLYATLKERFPITPLFVEASDGIQTQATENPAPLLLDTFEAGLGAWQADSGWEAQPLDRTATIPGEGEENLVARTQGCSFCFMTLKTPMDLSAYESVTLSFYRWMDADTGDLEFFGVEIGNKGLYKRVKTYGKQEGDGQWHHETVTLTDQDLSDAFTLRFFGMARNAVTTFALDNVMLTPPPGTVVIEPDPPPTQGEERSNLTIASLSISPTNPASGTPVTVRLTVRNDGTETANSETVRLYRHRTRTSTPTTGGTRLSATTTTGSLAPGASVTRTLSATTPSVTTTTTFYYYACADSADGETETDDTCSTAPATVTVQPPAGATPEQPPDLAIPSVTASPTNPESGGLITMQITVHNRGAGAASSEIIRVYRHAAQTANPTVNGARIAQTARSGSLAAGASATRSLSTVVPSVTSATTYHYYACIDETEGELQTNDNCGGPAIITVQAPDIVPTRERPMGGDLLVASPLTSRRIFGSGSITLGGIETTDGIRGFVSAAHVFSESDSGDLSSHTTDVLVGHSLYEKSVRFRHLLGKLLRFPPPPQIRWERRVFAADAAFVAYPHPQTPGCSLTWEDEGESFCLDIGEHDEYIERVRPLAIRGKNGDVYTVTGSQRPTKDLEVTVTGSESGPGKKGKVGGEFLALLGKREFYAFSYYISPHLGTILGDSGGPIYTIPDTNGNVKIVGTLYGYGSVDDSRVTVFSAWEDIREALELKPISP